jgi:hypothetical protein
LKAVIKFGLSRKVFIFKVLFFISFLFCQNLFAESWGGQYSYGNADFAGQLSKNIAPVSNFEILTLFGHAKEYSLKYYLSINAISTKVTHQGNVFPYPENSSLKVLAFLFVANLCHDPELIKWQVCGGIGQGTVNVNEANFRNDYGTWNYQLQLNYHYHHKIYFFTQIKYIGKVEIQTNGNDVQFGFYTYTLGLGYRF